MAELLGVSRSAYYRWIRYGTSNRRERADAQVILMIREIAAKHQRRYGSPRVREELRRTYGVCVSLKRVARLMRKNGLNARRKTKFVPTTTDSKHGLAICENILNRNFYAQNNGEKWVSDITYLRSASGWVYLTVIMDLFDRKIIGWALSNNMETNNTTIPALEMAVNNRSARQGLIFHSDRGVQYCAQSFRDALRAYCPTVRQSMSRTRNCWDNACAESFFKTLKAELETLNGKHSTAQVRQSVFFYIEAYYNRIRLHSGIDYAVPNDLTLKKVA